MNPKIGRDKNKDNEILLAKTIKLEDALHGAVHVSNEVDLKTAIQQGKLVIISSDNRLYKNMLEKFPREKLAKKSQPPAK